MCAVRESSMMDWEFLFNMRGMDIESCVEHYYNFIILFSTALSHFESKMQLDRVFWPNATTCSVVTQQRRSHAPDIKNPIGVCPRRIGAPKREAYQSIETHLQKRAVSFDQGCQTHASDLLDYSCSKVILTSYIIEIW
jgi:hypothetical protein